MTLFIWLLLLIVFLNTTFGVLSTSTSAVRGGVIVGPSKVRVALFSKTPVAVGSTVARMVTVMTDE